MLSYTDGNDGSGRGGIGGSLDGGLVRVVTTGFSEIDRMARGEEKGDKDHDERRRRPPLEVGRRSFGKFNRALEVCELLSLLLRRIKGSKFTQG